MLDSPVFERLRRRKLVQWGIAYLAAALGILGAMDALADPLGLTMSVQRTVLILLLVGLPATLVLAWYHGETGRQRPSMREALILIALAALAGVGIARTVASGDPSEETSWGELGDGPSVAVLPCANRSTDPADHILAASLHEEILIQLQKVSSVVSIGRTPVLQYGDDPPPTNEIAEALGVDYVGECTLQRQGGQIRLTFQLLLGETGTQVWARDYRRQPTAENLFETQADIARWVAREVSAAVTPEEQARLDAIPTESLSAYRAYLFGRLEWSRRNEEGMRMAIDYFTRAIAEDPDFAAAFAGLAEVYAVAPNYTSLVSSPEARRLGVEAARRAVLLDDELSESHVALGRVLSSYEWDWAGAEAAYLKAIELDPNSALARHAYGWYLHITRRSEEAVGQLRIAHRLDPFSYIIERNLGEAMISAGRFGEALSLFDRLAEKHPSWPGLAEQRARVLRAMGDTEAALREAPSGVQGIASLVALGKMREAEALFAQFDGEPPRTRLRAAAAMGDADAAMPLLEQAFSERQPWLKNVAYRWSFAESIRDDPRVQDLMRRMGFP